MDLILVAFGCFAIVASCQSRTNKDGSVNKMRVASEYMLRGFTGSIVAFLMLHSK